MKKRTWCIRIIVVALGCAVAACGRAETTPTPRECTEMGCVDGLGVELEGMVPEAYRIEAVAADGQTLAGDCPNGEAMVNCGRQQVFFEAFAPEEVTITVTWDGGSASETYRPDYQTVLPNGPGCPPECKQATVELPLS